MSLFHPDMVPRWPYRILRLLLPHSLAEAVAGDIEQSYRTDRACRGSWYAAWMCLRDVISWDTLRLMRESRQREKTAATTSRKQSSGGGRLGDQFRDLRLVARSLRKQPSFSLMVILLLTVGMGATTTIFSVVDGVLLRGLPYRDAHRLVFLDKAGHGSTTIPDYRDWVTSSQSFSSLAASTDDRNILTGDGDPVLLQGASVTEHFFNTIGVAAHRGRLFLEEDYRTSAPVVVVSHDLWQGRWGGDPSLVGRTLTLNDEPVTVIGILPPDFEPVVALWQTGAVVWRPLDLDTPRWQSRKTWILAAVGRLQPGSSLESARAEMDALAEVLANEYPETNRHEDGRAAEITVKSLQAATVGEVGPTLMMLLGAVGFLLLLTAANVANLMLARGADRGQELAVRAALGAGRPRLVRQLITEGLLLALAGGILGVAVAHGGVAVFRALNPGNIPRLEVVTVDWRVAGFALLLSIATGVVFAVLPAIRSTVVDLSTTLRDGGRATSGRKLLGVTNVIVAAEIAIALILLVGAGLLVNSFVRLRQVDPGFNPTGVATLELRLNDYYSDRASRSAFTRSLIERLEQLPGAKIVGASHRVPMGGGVGWLPGFKDAQAPESSEAVRGMVRTVTPGFLSALGAPIIAGRDLTWHDTEGTPLVGIVSTSLAEALWPGENPIGRAIKNPDDESHEPVTVVGLVGDIKYDDMIDSPTNLFVPYHQFAWYRGLAVAIRGVAGQLPPVQSVNEAVWAIDPALPIARYQSMDDRMSATVVTPRFYSALLLIFATIAVLLAAGGIYGTMLYGVGQRRREFGIRMALGARPGQILGLIVGRGLVVTIIGGALGVGGAMLLSRVLESMLFGISATDVPTYSAVVLTLMTVSLIACYLPGRRAASTDPARTLGAE